MSDLNEQKLFKLPDIKKAFMAGHRFCIDRHNSPGCDDYMTSIVQTQLANEAGTKKSGLHLQNVRCCPNCKCSEDFIDEDSDGVLFCNRCDALL